MLRRRFLSALFEETPDPRYAKTSLEQIAKADVWIFKKLARETREGIRPTSGILPLEKTMDVALGCPELAILPMPLPITKVKRTAEDGPSPQSGKRATKTAGAKAAAASSPSAQGQHGGDEKGKGKGKGKRAPSMPAQPVGLEGARADGQRRCYGYNLGSCKLSIDNGRCDRGVHECMKCGSTAHGAHTCTIAR